MAFDEGLAERLREMLGDRDDVAEQRMFGGIAFMVGGNMCVGITGDDLMVRVGNEVYADTLDEPHVRPMDFTGKPLKGFVYVEPDGYAEDNDLRSWLDRALAFVATLPAK